MYTPPIRPTLTRAKLEIIRLILIDHPPLADPLKELDRRELQKSLDAIAASYDARYGEVTKTSDGRLILSPPEPQKSRSIVDRNSETYLVILYEKFKHEGLNALSEDEQLAIVDRICTDIPPSEWSPEIKELFNKKMTIEINKVSKKPAQIKPISLSDL